MGSITIDAGHGGIDPGAVNGSMHEADYNLRVALLLQKRLEGAGVKVHMTRTKDELAGGGNDKSKSLNYRVAFNKEKKSDLFVSIHFNAGGGRGTEVLVNNADSTVKSLAMQIGNGVAAIMGRTHGDLIKDRPDLRVLKGNGRCMLLEIAFIDSAADMEIVIRSMTAIVEAIAKPLIPFLGGKVGAAKPGKDYDGHMFADAIDYVKDKGLMLGADDHTFNPDHPVTRGQLAAILQRIDAAKK